LDTPIARLGSSPDRETALARWDNEGGAAAMELPPAIASRTPLFSQPELCNTEIVQLRVRVVALENVLVALLAQSSDHGLTQARAMAAYISPRAGFTPHPITLHAATQIVHLVARAESFQASPPAPRRPSPEERSQDDKETT
jgi:hypothetical protein